MLFQSSSADYRTRTFLITVDSIDCDYEAYSIFSGIQNPSTKHKNLALCIALHWRAQLIHWTDSVQLYKTFTMQIIPFCKINYFFSASLFHSIIYSNIILLFALLPPFRCSRAMHVLKFTQYHIQKKIQFVWEI